MTNSPNYSAEKALRWFNELGKAKQEIARLDTALIRYGEHARDCACWDKGDHGDRFPRYDWECTCGLRQAIGGIGD